MTTQEILEPRASRLAVSRNEAAVQLGCSLRHIDYLIAQGQLTKVQIGARKVAVTLALTLRPCWRGGVIQWPSQTCRRAPQMPGTPFGKSVMFGDVTIS
jgi:hypothetical protein